ncbi:MAG: hypothetical protein CMK07_14280 [Ponticaulis sp.]|nr:hypothetical protein [Ponticaulis sp.]
MKDLLKTCLSSVACFAIASSPVAIAQSAQGPSAEKWDPEYEPPRMPDGTPSFAGVWSKSSLTTLERPDQFDELVIPPNVARVLQERNDRANELSNRPTDPNEGAPEAGAIEAYNTFWMDPGTRFAVVNGEHRTSWIVDPEDGQLPYSDAGRERMAAYLGGRRGTADNPEQRSSGERCTVGFGSSGGPPMLNVLYNNHVQFFQSEDVVSILVEMNHNARMVRLNGDHRPGGIPQWLGDSVGHWEGDTLVVSTKNFHPDHSMRGSTRHFLYMQPSTEVEERFTRVSDDVIFYEFTVTDPELFTQPWKGEMPLWQTEGPIYEYACHEGNYALAGILAGARKKEADAASDAAQGGQ